MLYCYHPSPILFIECLLVFAAQAPQNLSWGWCCWGRNRMLSANFLPSCVWHVKLDFSIRMHFDAYTLPYLQSFPYIYNFSLFNFKYQVPHEHNVPTHQLLTYFDCLSIIVSIWENMKISILQRWIFCQRVVVLRESALLSGYHSWEIPHQKQQRLFMVESMPNILLRSF